MQRSSFVPFAPFLVAVAFLFVPTIGTAQEPRPATAPAKPIATTPAAAPAKPEKKPVYDEAADARQDVAAAIARARRDNKRVLIQWGANWCGWCVLLAEGMQRDRDVATTLRNEYELVHVDVGRFDKHKELQKELGAELKSIPFLTVLDQDGKPIVQQNTEPFETKTDGKNGHDPKKLFAWLVQHQAAPLDANPVLAAGLETAKEQQKLVFLHFGAPWCGWCHRLENWMARPEIAVVLGEAFVDVKIDTDRMQGGKEVHQAQLAAAKQREDGTPGSRSSRPTAR